MSRVYCITGYPGAGKTAVANILQERGILVISMGDEVRERMPDSDEFDHTGEFATQQREKHGDDIVAQWTAETIENTSSDVVVVEGLRSLDELDYLKSYFDTCKLVLVKADITLRLERMQNRDRDEEKDFDLDELKKRDEREESWGLDEISTARNPLVIENNYKSIDKLDREIEDTLNL